MAIPELTWRQQVDHIVQIEREAEISALGPRAEARTPYWDYASVENLLVEAYHQLLMEADGKALQAMGSAAIQTATLASGASTDIDCGDVIDAVIQLRNGDTQWVPASKLQVDSYIQNRRTDIDRFVRYSLYVGVVSFFGFRIKLTYLKLPDLAVFRSDVPILPGAGYAEMARDYVHAVLQTHDFSPQGRI